MFDTVNTYASDLPLFTKLGLKPVFNHPCGKWIDLGTVTRDGARAEIAMVGISAQFFHIKVFNAGEDRRHYLVTTGSGSLEDYWHTVERLMDGMLNVESCPSELALDVRAAIRRVPAP